MDHGKVGLAEVRRSSNDRIEHGPQLVRRSADDLENFAGGCLPLKSVAQLVRPRLHLLEQSRVLDGDDGLVGKGLQESYLSSEFAVPRIIASRSGPVTSGF